MTHIEPDASTAAEKSNALIDSGIAFLFPRNNVLHSDNFFLNLLAADVDSDVCCCCCPGLVDPSELLANIEAQITKAKDEVLSRKEIMDRIDRWLSACEEENWLEDYNQVSWNK